jgi:glycosyltransferase involved in cell wall biosynthesis
VLIDHRPNHAGEMGGLVGTWEQLSQVACGQPALDLTLFFLGETSHVIPQAANVRHVLVSPCLGTERLKCFHSIPTHTDLAPFHPRLFRYLCGFDLLHTTDTFRAFARTALWKARLSGVPLVTSVHTDTIGWARIHTPAILQRLLPGHALTRWLLEEYGYLDRQERAMERRLARYLQHCAAVFVSHPRDYQRVQRLAPATPWFFLQRGLDGEAFHPRLRDPHWLATRFGIPPGRTVLLFVGRLDAVKGPLLAAEVMQRLVQRGHNVHLLVVGNGAQRQQVINLLRERGTLTGNLPHHQLPSIYASAALLLFPSESEGWPNVVMEARACGLPVLACARGAAHVMRGAGWDGMLLPDCDPQRWLIAAEELLAHPDALRDMGRRARHAIETETPSWSQVLQCELLPVWQQVVRAPGVPRPETVLQTYREAPR